MNDRDKQRIADALMYGHVQINPNLSLDVHRYDTVGDFMTQINKAGERWERKRKRREERPTLIGDDPWGGMR